jgi:hypothetical protein
MNALITDAFAFFLSFFLHPFIEGASKTQSGDSAGSYLVLFRQIETDRDNLIDFYQPCTQPPTLGRAKIHYDWTPRVSR